MNRRAVPLLALAGIVAVALGLRIWGIGFGLPYVYHYDERFYVNTALNLGTGVLHNRPYNPTGLSNVLFPVYAGYYAAGRLLGTFASPETFEAAYRSDPTVFYLAARLTSVILGAATVLALYLLGKELADPPTGLLAAGFLAVSFLHVRDSHYAVPDIAMACFGTLAVALSAMGVRQGRRRMIHLAGLAGGVAVALKWTALPVVLPVCWAAIRSEVESRKSIVGGLFNRTVVLTALALALGFAVLSPQILIKPAPYLGLADSIGELARTEASEAGGSFLFERLLFYGRTLLYGIGSVMLALAIAGLVERLIHTTRSDCWKTVLLCLFPAAYSLQIVVSGWYFARYLLALLPFLALFAAIAIWYVLGKVRRADYRRVFGTVLVIAVIAQPLAQCVWHDVILTREDTRTWAKAWIEEHVPEGSKIAMDWPIHGPPLSTPDSTVPYSRRVYDVHLVGGAGLSEHTLGWYRQEGFDYLISSSFIYQWWTEGKLAARSAFYVSLENELPLTQEFRFHSGEAEPPYVTDEVVGPAVSLWYRHRPGPTLKIYKVQ